MHRCDRLHKVPLLSRSDALHGCMQAFVSFLFGGFTGGKYFSWVGPVAFMSALRIFFLSLRLFLGMATLMNATTNNHARAQVILDQQYTYG